MPSRMKSLSLCFVLMSGFVPLQANPIPRLQPPPEVQKLFDQAQEAEKKFDWVGAVKAYEQMRQMAVDAKNEMGEADALYNIGRVYSVSGQPAKAFENLEQAAEKHKRLGDKAKYARTLNSLGSLAYMTQQLKKALDYFEQTLPLMQEVGDKNGEGRVLGNIANVYAVSGQPQQATEYYERGLKIARELKDQEAEARALSNIGLLRSSTGNFQAAQEALQQAILIYRQTGNKRGESEVLGNLGVMYANSGQYQKAKDYFEQMLSLVQQQGNKLVEARVRGSLGGVYFLLGQKQKSTQAFEKALALLREAGDSRGELDLLLNLGNVYAESGQPQKALETYQKVLPQQRANGNKKGEANALQNIGTMYARLKQPQKALSYFQQSLPLYQKAGDRSGEAGSRSNLAISLMDMGQTAKAIEELEEALPLMESVRGAMGGDASNRQSYFAQVLPNYATLTGLLVKQKNLPRAFAVVNQMKGRTLLEQGQSKQSLTGVPAEAQQKLTALRQKCNQLSLAVAGAGSNSVKLAQLKTELDDAERELQLEQDALFARFPGAAQKNVARTIQLADVPKFLPTDTALLEWVLLRDRNMGKIPDETLLFVITNDKGKATVSSHRLPLDQAALAKQTEAFRQLCAKPTTRYKPMAKALGAKLLPVDVRKRLAGKTRLIICPDGAVWSVPFAALITPNGRHLVQQFEINYAYSATGTQAALTAPRSKVGGTFALADPDFGDSSRFGDSLPKQIADGKERPLSEPTRPRVQGERPLSEPARPLFDPSRMGSMIERGKIKSLPGTKREAEALKRLYPSTVFLMGKQAQESELVKLLPHYRILHFATHGLFSDVSPLQSAIVLAQPPKGSSDDGFLTAREIYAMNLKAEMAVLSACETARGEVKSGEGVVGLTWALFVAGVPTQVVSQWKVSDASTPLLMEAFYRGLKNGEKKGQALRNAALTMMKDGKHSHPYHWASFVLFGDWR